MRPDRLVHLGVARTFQTVRLLPDLDVQQNIQLGADARTGRGGEGASAPRGDLLSRAQGLRRRRGGAAVAGRRRRDRADGPGGLRGVLPDRALLRDAAPGRDRAGHGHEPAAAPARRADGGHEPGRARRDLGAAAGHAVRGQPLPAPGGARRADDDRHLRLRVRHEHRASSSPRASPARSCRTRWCRRPTSEGSGASMLEINDLHVNYAHVEAVRGVSVSVQPGQDHARPRARTARARPRRSRRSPASSRRSAARSRWTATTSPGSPRTPSCAGASRWCPRAGGSSVR